MGNRQLRRDTTEVPQIVHCQRTGFWFAFVVCLVVFFKHKDCRAPTKIVRQENN